MKASLPFKYITAVKGGKHYVVFDYKDNEGKRKRKWIGTDLPEKCAKKALNLGFVDRILFIDKKKYEPPDEEKESDKDLTFPDFYDEEGEKVNTVRVTDFVQKVMNWKKNNEENS